MKRRLVCIVLSLVLLLTAFPVLSAENGDVTVSFTLTHGENICTTDGVPLAQQTLTVPYFDLALYGLQDYYYNPSCYTATEQLPGTARTAQGHVTLLHLLLFATEVYQCGLSASDAGQGYLADSGMMRDYISLAGTAGSCYMTLWGLGTNFNYFVNRVMPLGRENWMATSDQIVLRDGDSVRVHGLTGSAGGTNLRYFRTDGAYDAASAAADDDVTLTLTHCAAFTQTTSPAANEPVYAAPLSAAGSSIRTWRQIGVTDLGGRVTFSATALGAGTFCIASACSDDKAAGMQNAPAVFRLTVLGETPDAATVPVTISGLHEMQVHHASLFTYNDGVKGARDLLAGMAPTTVDGETGYALPLSVGDYWIDGFDSDGRCNGGLRVTVAETGDNVFRVRRVFDIHASNDGWQEGVDYAVYVLVTSPDGTVNRRAVTGSTDNYGTLRTTCLFLAGDTVKASFVPLGEKADSAIPAVVSKTLQYNTNLSAKIYEAAVFTFTAPEGSVVSVGRFSDYYVYSFFEPLSETATDDGRVRVTFRLPQEKANAMGSPNYFCRVQHPDGVTYWNFFDPSGSTRDMEITAQQLFINDPKTHAKTVLHHFENNTYDMADVYLNGTTSGCITMQKGDTYGLNVFRNWMAIENYFNAKVALPDVHYRVIDESGAPSDLLTVTPDAHNSGKAAVTANGSGTAILLVTYDAMFSEQAYKSGSANRPNLFSAIWPENTGVLVFRVADGDQTVETGMTLNGEGAKHAIDAEHDPLFYVGDGGASYTFTPESGCAVSVSRPVLTDESMTFAGFTADGVQTNRDGSVTLTGLMHGRNIVKLEKGGKTTYQVITAKHISYAVFDAEGEPLTAESVLRPGDTVEIRFSGLVNPVEKMSGVYNHNARIHYTGSDGTTFSSVAGGAWGVYDFAGNPERQKLSVTIPLYWSGETYTLSAGVIAMRISGSAPGSHRGVSYDSGMDPNFSAGTGGAMQGALPPVTFRIAPAENYRTVRLQFADTAGSAIDPTTLRVHVLDADGVEAPLQADGVYTVPDGEYTYTVTGDGWKESEGTFTVSADGLTVTVTLEAEQTAPQETTLREKILQCLGTVWYWLTHPTQFVRMLVQKIRTVLQTP